MKVLLPTDFSDNAFNACRYALQMFANDKVTFTLLHSYDINGYVEGSQFAAPPSEFALESAAHSAESALQQFKAKLHSYAASELHEFHTLSKNLDIIEAIVEQLRLQKVSLIVIGTQGSTGAYQTVYG